jgi:hypothetical protein
MSSSTNTSESVITTVDRLLENFAEIAKRNRLEIISNVESEAAGMIKTATEKVLAMEEEVQQWKEEKDRISNTQRFEPRIKIDIGGVRYTTSSSTLCRFPESMLGAMFSGRHTLSQDVEGFYFIDRDGKHFRHILNFLRDPVEFTVALSSGHLAELKKEAEYYGLLDVMFPITEVRQVHSFMPLEREYGEQFEGFEEDPFEEGFEEDPFEGAGGGDY